MRSATINQVGKDPAFRAWIVDLPCLICFLGTYLRWLDGEMSLDELRGWAAEMQEQDRKQESKTEHAHVGDDKGMSQKCSDLDALPLCGFAHHREGPTSIHKNPRGQFFLIHGIDRDAFIAKFCEAYDLEVSDVA